MGRRPGLLFRRGRNSYPVKPKFRQITLKLKKLIGLCYLTDELGNDSAAMESVITTAFTREFGFVLDDVIINGTGAGQPIGILNSGCLVTQAKESGQKAATVVAEKCNWHVQQIIAGE